MTTDLFVTRSILFLPASNPRAIAKARKSDADLVVLDLEDAVKPDDKSAARAAAVDAVLLDWPMPVAIRINGVGSEWHLLDIEAVAASKCDYAVLPRAASVQDVRQVRHVLGKPVLAMIETASGVLASAAIADAVSALIAGTNDLRADLRLPLDATRDPISVSLQLIILAARAAGIPAFDGVFNRLSDLDGFIAECMHGRSLGFDGKVADPSRPDRAVQRSFRPERGGNRKRPATGQSVRWRSGAVQGPDDRAHARGSGSPRSRARGRILTGCSLACCVPERRHSTKC